MNPEFMNAADSKFTFAAFCFTIKNLDKDPNYLVQLPVFWDATCSGIQHLTAIIKDVNLAHHVNLVEQAADSKPADLYSTTKEPINQLIRDEGMKDDTFYSKFRYINHNRKTI